MHANEVQLCFVRMVAFNDDRVRFTVRRHCCSCDEALRRVRVARPTARPNHGFVHQLRAFEQAVQHSAPISALTIVPGGEGDDDSQAEGSTAQRDAQPVALRGATTGGHSATCNDYAETPMFAMLNRLFAAGGEVRPTARG